MRSTIRILPGTLALLLAALWAQAQENTTPPAGSSSLSDAGLVTSPEELRTKLPESPQVVESPDGFSWHASEGLVLPILGIDDQGQVHVSAEVPVQRVAPPLELVLPPQDLTAAVWTEGDRLPALLERAAALDPDGKALQLVRDPLLGPHLASSTRRIRPDVVLEAVPVENDLHPSVTRLAIQRQVRVLLRQLDGSALGSPARSALRETLADLQEPDGDREDDELYPALVRRLVRHGWLRRALRDQAPPEVGDLEAMVTRACALQPVEVFEGEGLRLERREDAFGSRVWYLRSSDTLAYRRPLPKPGSYGLLNGATAVITLPADADPETYQGDPLRVELCLEDEVLASCEAGGELQVDPERWRAAVTDAQEWTPDDVARGYCPPHVVLVTPSGDLRGIVTSAGELRPPADDSPVEAETFLARAAQVLPAAPELDLLFAHFFFYVFDSPDPRYPELIGTPEVSTDIHQTAVQTLATTTGGTFRGDCDDLAELMHDIAVRQGRLAHIISLPQHAALAWVEHREDDAWHTFVLQTGMPLEFVAPDLAGSVEQAYEHFAPDMVFEPSSVSLMLRFFGENTRTTWNLSSRIFEDADYAHTMIDVQRDWHYNTYQRAIVKMKRLVEEGDTDPANYLELAGLYRRTSQPLLAAEFTEKAMTTTEDPRQQIMNLVRLVAVLKKGEENARATQVIDDILDNRLPPLQDESGRAHQVALELAGSVLEDESSWPQALNVLRRAGTIDVLTAQVDSIVGWVHSDRYDPRAWNGSPFVAQLRTMMLMNAALCIRILELGLLEGKTTPDRVEDVLIYVDAWLAHVALHDANETNESLAGYGLAGRYYRAVLGEKELIALLDQVEPPTDRKQLTTPRVEGVGQVRRDLPWIQVSVPFWASLVTDRFDKRHATLDREAIEELGARTLAAHQKLEELRLRIPAFEDQEHEVRLLVALATQDEAELRERIRYARDRGDRELRESTVAAIGSASRFLSDEWFQRVLQIREEEDPYPPHFFRLAWAAVEADAPDKALRAARRAVAVFPDDQAFREELRYMEELLGDGESE